MTSPMISQGQVRINHGTTLAEMLVVVVILSTGMTAVAAMLNDSINSLTSSLHQQRAVRLSADMAEVLSGIQADASWPAMTPADHDCEISACAPAELLAHMLHQWQRRIALQLPGGAGEFRFVNRHGLDAALLRLEWQNRGGIPATFEILLPVATPAESP